MTIPDFLHAVGMVFRQTRRFPSTHIFWSHLMKMSDVVHANPELTSFDVGRVPLLLNKIANKVWDTVIPAMRRQGLPTKDAEEIALILQDAAKEAVNINGHGPKHRHRRSFGR